MAFVLKKSNLENLCIHVQCKWTKKKLLVYIYTLYFNRTSCALKQELVSAGEPINCYQFSYFIHRLIVREKKKNRRQSISQNKNSSVRRWNNGSQF